MNVFYYTQLTDLMKIKFEKKSNVIYTTRIDYYSNDCNCFYFYKWFENSFCVGGSSLLINDQKHNKM